MGNKQDMKKKIKQALISVSDKSNLKPIFSFFTDGSGSQDLMESNNLITMKGSQIFFFTVKFINSLTEKFLSLAITKSSASL